jgi:hypothetical protein
MSIIYRQLKVVWSMWSDVHSRYLWWIVIQIGERWYSLYSELLERQQHSTYLKNLFLNFYILYSFLFIIIIIIIIIIREFKPKNMWFSKFWSDLDTFELHVCSCSHHPEDGNMGGPNMSATTM